jgi:hypothetical protein
MIVAVVTSISLHTVQRIPTMELLSRIFIGYLQTMPYPKFTFQHQFAILLHFQKETRTGKEDHNTMPNSTKSKQYLYVAFHHFDP